MVKNGRIEELAVSAEKEEGPALRKKIEEKRKGQLLLAAAEILNDNGNHCFECGREIPSERLEALREEVGKGKIGYRSSLCIWCAQKKESR